METSPDDDSEVVCRICRLQAEPERPLKSPCLCSGSIEFVHQACLNQWLAASGRKHCEVGRSRSAFRETVTESSSV
jgi:E3 ubiquitin-protein ligase MARCH6